MKKLYYPAIGIIIVTLILLIINQFTDNQIIQDYALIWIIAGMFFGNYLAKFSKKSDNDTE